MDIKTLLNRNNLVTARENAGFSTTEATKKISKSNKDTVLSWEIGESVPTFNQLEKLAKIYQVSPLLLLSPIAVPLQRIVPDFRSGNLSEGKDRINKLINLVIKRQGWLAEKLTSLNFGKNAIVGSGRALNTPDELAEYIIKKLDISHGTIIGFSGETGKEKTLKYLVSLLEKQQVFVGKTLAEHRLTVKEMRGLFINNDLAPFIVLNRKDAVAAQTFTLMHEVAHLFRATEGISAVDFRTLDKEYSNDTNTEEIFCNATAAAILIPSSFIVDEVYDEQDIRSLAANFNVSNLFAFYRLKSLGKILRRRVDDLEKLFVSETAEAVKQRELKKKKDSGGSHVNNMRDSNGGLFNRVVQSFYAQNQISYTEASNVLRFSAEQV
ncbi:MAG: ImmA/IrrE family metallo-endopeptidase [Candidatus Pacebacteria bacterium]|jgi:Zn-dependent peptidase ImmA (M78 family)|nr:ImmA/IrrE family metallo-endopeptidase [Candidatus Paceibacterota bacterium]